MKKIYTLIAAALLAGGFALRFCLVGAGAYDATQLPATASW